MRSGVELSTGAIVAEGAIIGEDVELGWHVVIHAGTTIGDGCVIEDNVVIGRPSAGTRFRAKHPEPVTTEIGAGSEVGSGAVISAGAVVGPDCLVGPLASVGERSRLAGATDIGTGVRIEHDVRVGRGTRIGTNAHLAAHSEIGDEVLVGPGVVVEPQAPGQSGGEGSGPPRSRIHDRATLGAGVVLISDVEIGQDAVVASGALVTRDVPPAKLVAGFPARVWREVPSPGSAHGPRSKGEQDAVSAENGHRRESA